jgi:hypothetical protein
MRIIDLFALQIFAKKSGRCNFRLLQHYPPQPDLPRRSLFDHAPKPKSDLPNCIYPYPGSRASTAPAELARTAGAVHLTGANIAVA